MTNEQQPIIRVFLLMSTPPIIGCRSIAIFTFLQKVNSMNAPPIFLRNAHNVIPHWSCTLCIYPLLFGYFLFISRWYFLFTSPSPFTRCPPPFVTPCFFAAIRFCNIRMSPLITFAIFPSRLTQKEKSVLGLVNPPNLLSFPYPKENIAFVYDHFRVYKEGLRTHNRTPYQHTSYLNSFSVARKNFRKSLHTRSHLAQLPQASCQERSQDLHERLNNSTRPAQSLLHCQKVYGCTLRTTFTSSLSTSQLTVLPSSFSRFPFLYFRHSYHSYKPINNSRLLHQNDPYPSLPCNFAAGLPVQPVHYMR